MPATRGIWFSERSNMDRVIYFFTGDGVYLGRIFVPAGELISAKSLYTTY